MVAVVEGSAENLLVSRSIDTRGPVETLADVVAFFQEYTQSTGRRFDALGVASFGPVDLREGSPT